jgi:hypothetical protein
VTGKAKTSPPADAVEVMQPMSSEQAQEYQT